MKSEHNANPAPADDEEVIELTDVVKKGPDAEETILDLTDVVETVKAEPHNPAPAFDEDQPLELGENAIAEADEAEPLVDLTDALDSPEYALSDGADDASDEAQALLDLDEILDDDADNDLALDLKDALDTPDDESTVLDLDDSLVDEGLTEDNLIEETPDGHAFDDGDTTADIAEEIEAVNAQAIDLADVLDAGEAEEDFLALDTPIDDADMVVEEASAPDVSVPDESEYDLLVVEPSTFGDALEVIEADPVEDPLAELETSPDDDGSISLDLVDLPENTNADESDDTLDLGLAIEPAADKDSTEVDSDQDSGAASDPAAGGLLGADDAGDDLDFKLDEMLAEAKAEMPVLDDDDTDMELDLSEALADAAADGSGRDLKTVLDLNAPMAPVVEAFNSDDTAEDEAEAFDLISEDKVIELDEPVVLENLTEAASKHDNVIDLADVTGGYPTISPISEFNLETPEKVSLSEGASPSEELSAETDALLEDVFLDEGKTADSIVVPEPVDEDEDIDLGITLDEPEAAEVEESEDYRLSPEMEKLEATLDDVFQDDEGDDLDLAMFADSASDDAVEGAGESKSEGAAPAADMVAVDFADAGPVPVATKVPVGDLPAEISEEVLDAAVSRVIKTMYADRIEQMILDVIKEAVTAEIDKVKRSLGDNA